MEERRKRILQELDERESVRVNELSAALGCSEVTIRNDIKCMEQEGLLIRIHGGAMKTEDSPERKYSSENIKRNAASKKEIAACAYSFINDRDTIILDDSSSAFFLALHIRQHTEKRVVAVTNSIVSAYELSGLNHVELYMVGGPVGGQMVATSGEGAVADFSGFLADKAFMGAYGVNFDVGITSVATPQLQIKQAIVKATKQVYVLADSSKFGGGYLSVVCPLEKIYKIITDKQVDEAYVMRAQRENIPLVLA